MGRGTEKVGRGGAAICMLIETLPLKMFPFTLRSAIQYCLDSNFCFSLTLTSNLSISAMFSSLVSYISWL